jgi:hypothetical protein
MSSMRTTGRRASFPRCSITAARRARHGHDGAQPVVPGPVPARAPGTDRPAAARVRDGRRRVSRLDRLPQGRPRARRPDHHGVAHVCRGNPTHEGHGSRRACCVSAPAC